MKEWGYKKNIPIHAMQWIAAEDAKRALEGKDTAFFYDGTHVTAKRIEKFRRRRVREVPYSICEFTSARHCSLLA